LLAFANVYFFESGLFNGLRAIQIKNFWPAYLLVWIGQLWALPIDLALGSAQAAKGAPEGGQGSP
jgi:hypothetical protein